MENFFPHHGKRASRARIARRASPASGQGPNVARSQLFMRQLNATSAPLSSITSAILVLAGLIWMPLAADAREVRVATFNIENGTGDAGSAKYEAIKDQLERIDADIVGFQELRSATFGTWSNMAIELGYDYSVIGGDNGSRAGYLFNGYFSHFPILSSADVLSPVGASEMARFPFRAVIEIPDAQNPLVLWNLHHKSGGNNIDKFRRAIEAYRVCENLDGYLVTNPTHREYVVLGDMNSQLCPGFGYHLSGRLCDLSKRPLCRCRRWPASHARLLGRNSNAHHPPGIEPSARLPLPQHNPDKQSSGISSK